MGFGLLAALGNNAPKPRFSTPLVLDTRVGLLYMNGLSGG